MLSVGFLFWARTPLRLLDDLFTCQGANGPLFLLDFGLYLLYLFFKFLLNNLESFLGLYPNSTATPELADNYAD
jgi:hypothetical protein